MAFLVPKNNAYSTLASGMTAVATSLTVATGEGSRFPSTFPFRISIDSEILECSARTTDTLTVSRSKENTAAATHATGAEVRLNITAGAITELQTAIGSTAHGSSIIGMTGIHPNPYYYEGYLGTSIVDLPTISYAFPILTTTTDTQSMANNGDWKGTTGARIQADADSDATHINDDDGAFLSSMKYHLVYTSSDAGGTANTGIYLITDTAAAALTVVKCSGTNFAASYYYWIRHSGITVPYTGTYLITLQSYWNPAEADKYFQNGVSTITGTDVGVSIGIYPIYSVVAASIVSRYVLFSSLTAGQVLVPSVYHNGTTGTPDLYGVASSKFIVQLLAKTA